MPAGRICRTSRIESLLSHWDHLEQHGKHLPVFTDSLIIGDVADRVEELRRRQNRDAAGAVAGALAASSPLRLRESRPDVLYVQMIRGMCRSLIAMGARKIFLLNGHGGNDIPCKAALRELKSEFESLRRSLHRLRGLLESGVARVHGNPRVTGRRHGPRV